MFKYLIEYLFTDTTDTVTIRANATGDTAALRAFRRRKACAILPVQSATNVIVELHQREQREDYIHICIIIISFSFLNKFLLCARIRNSIKK